MQRKPTVSLLKTEVGFTESFIKSKGGILLNTQNCKETLEFVYYFILFIFKHNDQKQQIGANGIGNSNQNGPSIFTPRLAQCGCRPWLCSLLFLRALPFLVGGNSSMC